MLPGSFLTAALLVRAQGRARRGPVNGHLLNFSRTWRCAGAGEPSRARDHHGGVPDHERWHARENRGSYIQAAHRPGRAKRPGDQHLSARTARVCHTHPGLDPRRAVCWQLPLSPTQVTPFHSSKPPTISVKSYLEDRCGGASTAQHRCAPPLGLRISLASRRARGGAPARRPGTCCTRTRGRACSRVIILARIPRMA